MIDQKDRRQAYAIVRLEDPNGVVGTPELEVTVKEVVPDLETAKQEVARLNTLNAAKGCRYLWQATRLVGFSDRICNRNDSQ